ncbi:OsmC family protein [Ponticoccus sp. SC2-23]|uniref:OsmC family protein n=1 Tax=Alexandriicola marinus TaxID=2081710 RepID=UPI000FDB1B9F|nr:OsmC family protein [Alexandriicola marinus]MBM1219190.1 OsmC family protein [Ponticoccus sp. SC6-9]MBM1223738.1 OsmC family protein [Ponticoccus sp. SC6-15]MBM1229004.1 OsmC family protein [Ponticoccus sp. SC6-38]MBM1232704.1 OsmC family protein [Ponticoccus sp. SC6-45]MBM1237346.1 OsmC family protein [Ponticoccus sp. SC6-49]MBM1241715.1 OsmC family protein [Ponticoccus sp. SC2-64]MBM1246228.1 OsmC family protein [Ponticoccus sp. SC6-42]MBM1250706.1 OsmC family protein [Ponticoccus sp. 
MAIRPKTVVQMKVTGTGETHARSQITARDVASTIDEPFERDGTNMGLTPTETLMSSLIGCTNVISKRIAQQMGFEMGEMTIVLTAKFDRRGTMLMEEIDVPFPDVIMDIDVATDGTPEQMEAMKADLARFCPVAKVMRAAGTTITENWSTKPL